MVMTFDHKLTNCVIRPIDAKDADSFIAFAELAGDGMTTMPRDEQALLEKIDRSIKSFSGDVSGKDAEYFMVMEDLVSGSIVGCTAVYPSIGHEFGFFSYRRLKQIQNSKELGIRAEVNVLHLTNEFTGYTEVGSLILHPDWRGTGGGKLLAKSRYLLIAEFPHLFASTVMAEMRGHQSEDGRSLFWESVGERFFNMPFAEADHISAVKGNEFIADLMPTHPLYLDLMDPDVVEIIGKPHEESAPAMAMLLKEGFEFRGCVDVFDAGPQVTANIHQINTIRNSRTQTMGDADLYRGADRLIGCTRELDQFQVRLLQDGMDDEQGLWDTTLWSDTSLPVRLCALE